jgi:DNA repair protein RAD5
LHPDLVLTGDEQRALSPVDDGKIDADTLIKRFAEDGSSTFADEFVANLKGEDNRECPICFSEMEIPMVVPKCMHQLYGFSPL